MYTGVIFACVQSLCSVDLFKDCVKKAPSAGASSVAVSFKNLAGTQSGPDALLGFKSCSSFSIHSDVIVSSSMDGNLSPFRVGIAFPSSWVKTDVNWSFKIFALSILSLNNTPSRLSGDIPTLSCFLALMYFQNGLESLLFKLSDKILLT